VSAPTCSAAIDEPSNVTFAARVSVLSKPPAVMCSERFLEIEPDVGYGFAVRGIMNVSAVAVSAAVYAKMRVTSFTGYVLLSCASPRQSLHRCAPP
jgi:hypothetical protein